ncbi:MAG: MraY family glycosyltransferase [Vicinamibacterales bacterium]
MVIYAILFAAALSTAYVLMPMLERLGKRAKLMDQPDDRKVHVLPTPRLGGVGVALSLVATFGVAVVINAHEWTTPSPDPGTLVPILAGALLVFAVGLWDDVSPVPPRRKLFVQLVAAGFIVGSGILITRFTLAGETYELGLWAYPFTMLWIVMITNAFNLIDGLDGLAGGLVVIAAFTCSVVLIVRGEEAAAMLLVGLTGATFGFLIFNYHPARIFLGDSGSLLAGFLLAVTAIVGRQKGATTLATAVPLLIFALPLADTLVSIVRRLLRSPLQSPERVLSQIFSADKGHIHHRLLSMGLSHRNTVLLFYVLATICSALALFLMEVP